MTIVRLCFAAEKAGTINAVARNGLLDSTGFHQVIELLFKICPLTFFLFDIVEYLFGWRKLWKMNVLNPANRFQKVTKVSESNEGHLSWQILPAGIHCSAVRQ